MQGGFSLRRWPNLDAYPDPPADVPLPYRPYRDGAWWLTTALLVPWVWIGWLVLRALLAGPPDWWVLGLIGLGLVVQPLGVYWVLWDTHRWAVPLRWAVWLYALLPLGFLGYLPLRSEWLMRVARAKHLEEQ